MSSERVSGEQQGSFRINFGKQVGEGNTSKVFLAQKGDGPSVYVAKVLRPEHRGEEPYFAREVNLHKKLRHKNVVLLDHNDRIPSLDLPYFAMPRASDGTFLEPGKDRVKNFPIKNAVDYLLQGASGLQYVHDEGIAHNDVQPNNFLLNRLDNRLTVWLADFGIAGKLSENRLAPGGHTGYIAPEKTGQSGLVTKSTDLYAFGTTAFQLITGELPFGKPSQRDIDTIRRELNLMSEEDMRTEAWEKKHRTASVPAFTDRWDTSRFPDPEIRDVREALQTPVMKALAKRPEDRHGSVGDFAEDLKQHFDRAVILHNKHKTTITSPDRDTSYRPVSRRIELPDEKDRTVARDRDLTKREHAELRRIAKALGTPRGRSTDALAEALSKSMWFKEHNPAQRKELVKLYLEQQRVAGILREQSKMNDADRLGRETAFSSTTPSERAQLAKNYRDHKDFLVKSKRRRRITLGVGAAGVAASAVLFATSGAFEGPQKPETIATLPDYKNLPPEEKQLLLSQQEEWKEFFGGYINIPRPPQELFETMSRLKKKGYDSFKPFYIPEITTTADVAYPGWKEKPHDLMYDQDDGEQRTTKPRWVLIDMKAESGTTKGDFSTLVDRFRKAKEAQNRKDGTTNWQEEPKVSGDEIKTAILPSFAKEIARDKSNTTLPTLLEYNLLDNTLGDDPTWETKTNEEWTNSYRSDYHEQQAVICMGSEDQEGYADYAHSDEAKVYIGFRPIINFPQTK